MRESRRGFKARCPSFPCKVGFLAISDSIPQIRLRLIEARIVILLKTTVLSNYGRDRNTQVFPGLFTIRGSSRIRNFLAAGLFIFLGLLTDTSFLRFVGFMQC